LHSFKKIAVLSAALLIVASLCACNTPVETSTSSETTSISISPATSGTETVTETTETVSETTSESTTEAAQSSVSESVSVTTSMKVTETQPKLNTAQGKFNYVLKNKSWKYDGEMYYHKYKDGTVAYYDKETKSYFLIDSKGQGWYYDPDLKDFVRDE
jgi:hypothetical protein